VTTKQPAANQPIVLALADITKQFGSNRAVDSASFDLRAGTVHALLGENGAGKTTLMRIAFGLIAPDAGSITVRGTKLRFGSPADAIAAGLGMVHQHFTNVPAMTVAENVALGGSGRFSRERAQQRVAEIGVRTGLVLDAAARAGEIGVGAQQRLEIVKALARDASILVMDEPTAVLAPDETEELLRWLRGFADSGNAVVLITHKLREALAVADDVTVLRRGQVVLHADAKSVTFDSLSHALIGEDLTPERVRGDASDGSGETIARVANVSIVDRRGVIAIRDASFDVRAGEILGIAAVEGAGQRELLRAVGGRIPVEKGTIEVPASIGFVPEDRHRDSLILDFTAEENVVLKGAGCRRGRIAWAVERERTWRLVAEYDVRGFDERAPVRTLSGGNQQKLILGRELDGNPRLLLAENPSRGLDLRATRAVHDRLRAVAGQGAAVIVYSSDLDEVLSLATRVLVIHAGVVRESARDRDAVGRAMLGVA
jgi:ABC-type uncharacterized transport systems, ATPase components